MTAEKNRKPYTGPENDVVVTAEAHLPEIKKRLGIAPEAAVKALIVEYRQTMEKIERLHEAMVASGVSHTVIEEFARTFRPKPGVVTVQVDVAPPTPAEHVTMTIEASKIAGETMTVDELSDRIKVNVETSKGEVVGDMLVPGRATGYNKDLAAYEDQEQARKMKVPEKNDPRLVELEHAPNKFDWPAFAHEMELLSMQLHGRASPEAQQAHQVLKVVLMVLRAYHVRNVKRERV